MSEIVIGADTTNVNIAVEGATENVRSANLAMITAIRQTAQAGILVLQIAGVAIDQVMSLYVETLLVGIEVAVKISSATSLATFGISGFFMIGQIVAMLLLIKQIRSKQVEASHKTSAAVQLLRLGTY